MNGTIYGVGTSVSDYDEMSDEEREAYENGFDMGEM